MRNRRIKRLFPFLMSALLAERGQSQEPFQLDTGFQLNVHQVYVSSVAALDNGDLMLSGQIRLTGELFDRGYMRVTPEGTRVLPFPDFAPGGGKLVPWENGRLYVGNGDGVRRIMEDGSLDPEFILINSGPYFSAIQGGDYHVFPDGRVLMSGAHILSDSIRGFEGMYNLIWFSNEGYLDTTRTHRYCDEVIFAIEEQPDGKFLCSGTMNSFEDQPVKRVFRVHPDGELDHSFDADIQQWGEARDYLTLSDGRIWVGGSLRLNGSQEVKSLIRLMPDGAVDPSFHVPQFAIEFDPFATIPVLFEILQVATDRFIVTGRFDRVDGQVRGGIAMLDANGNLLDDAFTGEGCGLYNYNGSLYKSISGITPAPDGSFYIYGAYHGYDDGTTNDTTQRMVSRLHGLDVGVQEVPPALKVIQVAPNPGTDRLTITADPALAPNSTVQLVDAQGRVIATTTLSTARSGWSIGEVAPGCYMVRILDGAHVVHITKWIRT